MKKKLNNISIPIKFELRNVEYDESPVKGRRYNFDFFINETKIFHGITDSKNIKSLKKSQIDNLVYRVGRK